MLHEKSTLYTGTDTTLLLSLVSGASREEVKRWPSLRELSRMTTWELEKLPGLGTKRAEKLFAALFLGKKAAEEPLQRGDSFTSAHQIWRAYRHKLSNLEQETFHALLLDKKNRVISSVHITTGTQDRCVVSPGDVFREAVREGAISIILIHNHPSGDPDPSPEDRSLTARMVEVGKILGVQVLDHVVIGSEGFVSFQDRGWMI